MAKTDRAMRKAQDRLSRNLGEPTITDALDVLDKAVTGLISLAKGDASDGASGKKVESPYGRNTKNPYGSDGYDITPGGVGEDLETYREQYNKKQKTASKVTMNESYAPGNPAAALGFSMAKAAGGYGGDLEAAWGDDDDDQDDDDDEEGGEGDDMQERMARLRAMQNRRRRDDDDEDDDDEDDEEDDDDDEDDEEDEEEKGWGMQRGYGNNMRMAMNDDDDDEEGYDDGEDDDDDDDDEEDDDEDDDDNRPRREDDDDEDEKSFARSWSMNDIHKALVSGPNGARVAEVVEASRELAQMVNVFGSIMSDISGQVSALRRDQRNSSGVLADAVNTVVKSQAAIALGLERMAKSAASLARNNSEQGMAKSYGVTSPNPGVVMNGKVMMEGNTLRRSNAMVDETGSAYVAGGVENRLTKSLVGGVIQQAVLDGEFSAKDALRWLTETDSPASGPVAVFRQLPVKLQDRIARRADDVQ